MTQRLDRINRFLEGFSRHKRDIMSPEGVALEVEIANHGERMTAFVIDFFFWGAATIFLFVVFMFVMVQHVSFMLGLTIVSFINFTLRNLYFIYFEYAANGTTPGKRIVGLRVINRHGGPLLPTAIVARNLTREVEIFLPLGMYAAMKAANSGQGFWTSASYFAWMVLISALPFFNRDHLRAGDFIAGTMVIAVPRRNLDAELAKSGVSFAFSRSQLEIYGAFELQVLEELLRRPSSPETTALRREVCDKICRKIQWTGPDPGEDPSEFLHAFYTAERAHLEREQMFGKYRADKFGAE